MVADLLITFLLVFLNGFFVAAEFAIVKVRASQLEMKVVEGQSTAILAKRIVTHLDGYLAATQLGITLASLGLGWIGEPVVSKLIIRIMGLFVENPDPELAHNIALPIAFALITILHIVFGELAPKSFAIQRSEATTLFVAYPLRFFYVVFKPFIWLLNGIANLMLKRVGISPAHGMERHSSDELKYLVQQGRESGEIEPTNYDIIKNAFSFSERTVKQVMIPRPKMTAIGLSSFNDEALERVISEGYSRIPVYENDWDDIVGVVHLKDILLQLRKGPLNIRELMRPVMIIPETKRIGQLLKEFQVKHQQIAIVVNEYGATKGMVTMEDILEELVGEIQDEFDDERPFVEQSGDKIFTVLASAFIDDINELLPHPIPKSDEYETLAGHLILKFGRIPNVNDKTVSDDYEFTVLKKSKSSIMLIQLRDLLD